MDAIPIETTYRGYRFRSRLEAKWAVFFDALKLAWDYEPEGFDLGGGTRYLPDFFLPTMGGVYAEVKPFDSAANWRKAIQLASASKRPVLLLDGPPDLRTYRVAGHRATVRFSLEGLIARVSCPPAIVAVKYLDPGSVDDGVIKAVHAARAARFEFGAPLTRVI